MLRFLFAAFLSQTESTSLALARMYLLWLTCIFPVSTEPINILNLNYLIACVNQSSRKG